MQAHRVAVLALPGVVAFDLGVPAQVLGSSVVGGTRPYDVGTCTPARSAVPTSAGFDVLAPHGLELLDRADTVIVPGVESRSAAAAGEIEPAVASALRAAAGRGARMVSICTGAFVLAAAGLLDDRPATTHWAHAERFGRLFPRVRLDPRVLFVDDGDVLTSAGVAAGVDLCLHLVRGDHGARTAADAARRCVVPPWRDGGQAQFIERAAPPAADSSLSAVREWALERLGDPLTLDALAARAGVSVRTFTRRFRAETGVSPLAWLIRQRVEYARELLEDGAPAVDRVAAEAGFGSAASLRQHFQAAVGVSPAAYRRTFRIGRTERDTA